MTRDDRIREVQRLYPLLYFASHDSHRRSDGLSESAMRLLHHISATPGIIAADLGRHLGLSRSRLSEALRALERDSFIERTPGAGGRKEIRLTPDGQDALTSSEGIHPRVVGAILDRLSDAEQERVLEGLRLVKRAIGELQA